MPHFNPRSPHGERLPRAAADVYIGHFNPRSPHGERRTSRKAENGHEKISIHAPRTGSDLCYERPAITDWISIHAPRTGSDATAHLLEVCPCDFNPRSPHGERRQRLHLCRTIHRFQSTLPARGATPRAWRSCFNRPDFNPRSPHGERQSHDARRIREDGISIHAPRTGSDDGTHPRRGHHERISIHAPRTGSDAKRMTSVIATTRFQSTLPARGATDAVMALAGKRGISIHAPRTGSDVMWRLSHCHSNTFQSTLPARGATKAQRPCCARANISIHAPRTGSDHEFPGALLADAEFQSTLPARGATEASAKG